MASNKWHLINNHNVNNEKFLGEVWYRGISRPNDLTPGVYRDDFKKIAKQRIKYESNPENQILELERRILQEFRTSGAESFDPNNIIDVYFTAQHYGMPTRLLDWTTNPLAGLFFALDTKICKTEECDSETEQQTHKPKECHGEVFIMHAKELIKDEDFDEQTIGDKRVYGVEGVRHPYIKDAIGQSFWYPPLNSRRIPLIIPIRPDNQHGRIGQQSSCFTLHMHKSNDSNNPSLVKIKIPAESKKDLLNELHRLNINKFTIYGTLDHLSKEIKRLWGLR